MTDARPVTTAARPGRRRRTLTVGLTCGLLALAACSSGGGSSSSPSGSSGAQFTKDYSGALKISGFNPSDEVGKSRGDLATKAVSPATVTLDTTGFDAQKFSAQVASGQAPDLIQTDRATIGTLADKGLVIPLDECYATQGVTPKERYYQAALDDLTYNGHLYGVPQFFQASIIIGNKTVMDAAGVTTADLDTSKPDKLVAAAKKMAKVSGGKTSVLGFDGDLPGSSALWIKVFGGKLEDDKGKPTLDDPNNVKALTFMKQLVDAQGGYASVKSLKDTFDAFGDGNQYVKNQVGAQTWAQWYVNVLSGTKDKVKVVGVPVKTLDGKTLGFAGGTAFAIPKAGKNPSAACAWAVNATSPEAWDAAGKARAATVKEKNAIMTGLFTGSPVADKAVREKYVTKSGNADFDQVIDTTYEALSGETASVGGSAVGQEITNDLNGAVQQALNGESDVTKALADAQASALRDWGQSSAAKNG